MWDVYIAFHCRGEPCRNARAERRMRRVGARESDPQPRNVPASFRGTTWGRWGELARVCAFLSVGMTVRVLHSQSFVNEFVLHLQSNPAERVTELLAGAARYDRARRAIRASTSDLGKASSGLGGSRASAKVRARRRPSEQAVCEDGVSHETTTARLLPENGGRTSCGARSDHRSLRFAVFGVGAVLAGVAALHCLRIHPESERSSAVAAATHASCSSTVIRSVIVTFFCAAAIVWRVYHTTCRRSITRADRA